jgi:hypothetical protein
MNAAPPDPPVSRVVRFGAAVGTGTLGAMVASVPATFRVVAGAEPPLAAPIVWAALAGATLVPCVVLVVLFRAARRGLASFGGEGASGRALGFLVWLFGSFDALLAFGALLRATTHHNALAGATFAVGGLVALTSLGVVVRRVVALADEWAPPIVLTFFGAALVVLLLIPLFLAMKVGRASPAAGVLVDALAFLIAAGFASRASFGRWRALGVLGPPLAVLLLFLGASSVKTAPVAPAVRARAPLLSAPVDAVSAVVAHAPELRHKR